MGDGMWGWPSRGGLCLAGFAHGAAGIALALGRLSLAARRPDFGHAALAACRYEATLYDAARGNWPVLSARRAPGERIVMTAWCHGAPGIAIALSELSGILDEAEIGPNLARALSATRRAGPLGTDHLCCGNAGLVEALLTCGQTRALPEARSRASALLTGAIERGAFRFEKEEPGPPLPPAPGFFRGLSGVGYTLLRVAAPALLPCVLGFAGAAGSPAASDESGGLAVEARRARLE
jgi:lantibiotic modifying enzyme